MTSPLPSAPTRADVPSYWLYEAGAVAEDVLDGDSDADICIVGAGLTGLWTAYYLSEAQPDARIVVLEQRMAGFGASGRNAGWLTSEFPMKFDDIAAIGGAAAVRRMHAAMNETVDVVLDVCRKEGIDADILRGGVLRVAQTAAQEVRAREEFDQRVEAGADAGYRWMGPQEIAERVDVAGVRGGYFTEFGARVQPAKLVRGLLEVVRRRGVRVHEDTRVDRIDSGRATTSRGVVTAPIIVRSVEAYAADLPGHHRDWLPMQSSIVVTDPIPEAILAEIGWAGGELVADAANWYGACQITPDRRIVMGARGLYPGYAFGSRMDRDGSTSDRARAALLEAVHTFFPALRGEVGVFDSWSGVLAVPRDWRPTVTFDARTGLAAAGGYFGSGVSTTNLAGRTLAELITGADTGLRSLPWTGHDPRGWEPEPLRWLGVNAMARLYEMADRREYAGLPRPSRWGRLGARIVGH